MRPISVISACRRLLALNFLLTISACSAQPPADTSWNGEDAKCEWRFYLGDAASQQYSSLDEINKQNVHRLETAWIYHTRDRRRDWGGEMQCNPIIVNGLLYGSTTRSTIFALDAATGKEIWRYEPYAHEPGYGQGRHRGVTYWQDGDDKRILFTAGAFLHAVDARTGALIPGFGDNGRVRLDHGLDRTVVDAWVDATTPGIIYKNLYILGTRVSENKQSAPGHIRAYDARTGERAWIFHTIPHPGEFGHDTWPEDAWKTAGGANSWAGMSLDRERGLLYVPTGSPSYDFYGGDRPGQNLFGNSLICLNAFTGERVWHYQFVHHDIWDRDLPAPPNLVTIERDGRRIPALAQVTKSGHVFVFNRLNGRPLFPIEEKQYPASDIPGEVTWPTQPLPVKPPPFTRQIFRAEDVTDVSEHANAYATKRFAEIRSDGQFVPPSLQGTMIFPGFDGGAEWGGASYDPESGRLYVNANEMPWILTLVPTASSGDVGKHALGRDLYMMHCANCHGTGMQGDAAQIYPALTGISERLTRAEFSNIIQQGKGAMQGFAFLGTIKRNALIAYINNETDAPDAVDIDPENLDQDGPPPFVSTGYHRFTDDEGNPAIKPPWGTLTAIDLNRGEIDWQVPLGELRHLTARGIPQTGTENYGGPVTTAGGLVFIGATKDEMFRAFDKDTGEVLWETKLPFGGYATPAVYVADGRQYVVIAAGGGKMNTPSGDVYIAFALGEER